MPRSASRPCAPALGLRGPWSIADQYRRAPARGGAADQSGFDRLVCGGGRHEILGRGSDLADRADVACLHGDDRRTDLDGVSFGDEELEIVPA